MEHILEIRENMTEDEKGLKNKLKNKIKETNLEKKEEVRKMREIQ